MVPSTRCVLPVSSGGSQLDVQRRDAELFAALCDVLCGQHGGVRRRLISVGLHLHPAGHAADRLPGKKQDRSAQEQAHAQVFEGPSVHGDSHDLLSREISDVDEGVVKGGEDVTNSKHVFSFSHLRSQTDDLLLLLFLPFTRSHRLWGKKSWFSPFGEFQIKHSKADSADRAAPDISTSTFTHTNPSAANDKTSLRGRCKKHLKNQQPAAQS